MKNSVPELKKKIAAANKQIKLGKQTGDKRTVNLGRRKRLEAWRELRDEYGMEPPAHVAKALGEPNEKTVKKTVSEFVKPSKELSEKKPKKKGGVWVSENEMDFTRLSKKEFDKLVQEVDKAASTKLAKLTTQLPSGNKKVALKKSQIKTLQKKARGNQTIGSVSSPKLRKEVYSWLNTFPRYADLIETKNEEERLARAASERARNLFSRGITGIRLKRELDILYRNRNKAIETRRKIEKMIKNLEDQFFDEHSFDPQLVQEYSKYKTEFRKETDLTVVRLFNDSEERIMDKIEYAYHSSGKRHRPIRVRGKNRLGVELKKTLLEKARKLLDLLPGGASEQELENIEQIEKMAPDPNKSVEDMMGVLMEEKDLTPEEKSGIQLALLGETVDNLRTRVAMLGKKKPTQIARASPKKGKKAPVKIARLEKTKKEEKKA